MKNKHVISKDGKTVYIQLHHKDIGLLETQIDVEDFTLVNRFKTTWVIGYKGGHIDGVKTKVQQNGIRKQIWLHRLIMQPCNKKVVDHINGDTLDNRKCNLRVVTPAENATNKGSESKNKSGFTNIYLEKDGKYRVRINHKSFGRYDTIIEALNMRDKIVKKIFPLRER